MEVAGPDKDVKAAFDSLEVHQDKNEAVLTASVPYAFFQKVLKEPPVQLGPSSAPQAPAPVPVPNERPRAK